MEHPDLIGGVTRISNSYQSASNIDAASDDDTDQRPLFPQQTGINVDGFPRKPWSRWARKVARDLLTEAQLKRMRVAYAPSAYFFIAMNGNIEQYDTERISTADIERIQRHDQAAEILNDKEHILWCYHTEMLFKC